MATLREDQLAELELLKYLDQVCRKNNLHYLLAYGTMLGAVRHQGFIPWDDDVDVFMPLKDAKKLINLVDDKRFFLQAPQTDIQMPYIMYKLRLQDSLMIEPGSENSHMNQGIWLDIFTYIPASRREKSQILLRKCLQSYRCRYRYVSKENRRFIHYLLTKLPLKLQILIDDMFLKLLMLSSNSKSQEYFILGVTNECFYKKSFFDKVCNYTFEGLVFGGAQDYDSVLSMRYGNNYMIPKKWNHLGDFSDVVIPNWIKSQIN